jgi:hypothetical protein
MQNQEGLSTPSGRSRLVLFIVAVTLLCILLWLLFFRSSSPTPSSSHTTATKQHQPSGQSTGGDTGQSGAEAGGSTTTPSQLANTGAGNVLGLIAATSAAGALVYQVKLRKKLGQ